MFANSLRVARPVHAAIVLATCAALARPAVAGFNVFSVGGDTTAASIQPTVDAFRAALGDPNNGNMGPQGSGRREINWDGGGSMTASFTSSALTAFTNTRGATFLDPSLNPQSGLLQTPLDAAELANLHPSYATTFSTFSNFRIFTPTGSNITQVTFSLPGSMGATPATVSGFGAVFSDVDLPATTTIELFDFNNASLGVFSVPQGMPGTAPNGALSFLGLQANAGERIARAHITTGNAPLGAADSNGNPVDVVVMDDFLYAEPVLIPEPAAAVSAVLALAAFLRVSADRRR